MEHKVRAVLFHTPFKQVKIMWFIQSSEVKNRLRFKSLFLENIAGKCMLCAGKHLENPWCQNVSIYGEIS